MNKLLGKKTKKSGKKKSKKSKTKSSVKKVKKVEEKKEEEAVAWSDDEVEETPVQTLIVEKEVLTSQDKPSTVNIDDGWKDEEIKEPEVVVKEEPVKKAKVIKWGDTLKSEAKAQEEMGEESFPEIGADRPVKKKKKAPAGGMNDKFNDGGKISFHNSNLKNKGDLLSKWKQGKSNVDFTANIDDMPPKRRERENDGFSSNKFGTLERGTDFSSNSRFDDGGGVLKIKGKVKLNTYKKSQAEIMQEKMRKEIEERKAKEKEAKESGSLLSRYKGKKNVNSGLFRKSDAPKKNFADLEKPIKKKTEDAPKPMLLRGNKKRAAIVKTEPVKKGAGRGLIQEEDFTSEFKTKSERNKNFAKPGGRGFKVGAWN